MYFGHERVFEDQERQYLMPDGVSGSGIGANYDNLVERYLADEEIHWTHFLCMEDDMWARHDCLHILARRELDVVGANYSTNKGKPQRFTAMKDNETVLTYPESTGVEEVDYIAQGFTLIRREVFEAVERPRFPAGFNLHTDTYVSQDYVFSTKARDAGFKLYVDHDVSKLVSHEGPYKYTYEDALRDELEKRKQKEATHG
jgi:hypothetical protein